MCGDKVRAEPGTTNSIGGRALMACPNYWGSPLMVGSHHIANGLVDAGWRVAYVSDPISPLHWLAGSTPELRERFTIYRAGGISLRDARLWAYVPGAPLTPHNQPGLRNEWLHREWWRLSWPNVVRTASLHGFDEVDLLYLDSIVQEFWLKAIRPRRSVYRVADKSTGFRKSTPATARLERELARSVDVVVYTARHLLPHVNSLRPKQSLYLPNGVDFDHFARGDRSLPPDLADVPRPIAIYVGSLDVWFDYALMNFAARHLPDVSFVLIGPDNIARKRLARLSNIFLLGSRSYESLPRYLHNADVGLIPFDVSAHPELIHSVNPLKLYEYMACGLPVVAVEWAELLDLASPALLCRSHGAFVEAIQAAIGQATSPEINQRFAASADWKSRITSLLRAVVGP